MKVNIDVSEEIDDGSYEYTSNRAKVSKRGVAVPGRTEVSLAAVKPCRLQLCTL